MKSVNVCTRYSNNIVVFWQENLISCCTKLVQLP